MDNPVRLSCAQPGATIATIVFASYGTPVTLGPCGNWTAGSCDAGRVARDVIAAACVGAPACSVPTFGGLFGDPGYDPCPAVSKSLAIVATCDGEEGGRAGGGASCAVNGTACPAPAGWAPQWGLAASTVCQPGSDVAPGYWAPAHPWGLVSLDWSVAASVWRGGGGPEQATVEATLTENCRRIKAASPSTRCLVYHNLELALQVLESQRGVMYDPSKAAWFVQYTDGAGRKNGTIYNEPDGDVGDQFFWDFRVPAAVDWYVASVLALTSSPWVDGVFTDDLEGFGLEHDFAPASVRVSLPELAELQFASLAAHGVLVDALARAGKLNWQAAGGGYEGE